MSPRILALDVAGAPHRWINVGVAERSAAGMSVAITFGDSPPAYLGAGTLAFDTAAPFDADSICRIYSMTKNITRIAALLLVEDGKLALDQSVAEVLPEFRSLRVAIDIEKGLASRPATKAMTMRHLITNTSGLGNWTPASDSGEELHRLYRERGITPGSYGKGRLRPGYGAQPATLDELVARVADLPLAYEPGTVLHYSIGFENTTCVLLHRIRRRHGSWPAHSGDLEYLRHTHAGPPACTNSARGYKD